MMRKRTRAVFLILAIISISSFAIGGYDEAKREKTKSKDDLYAQIELFADAVSLVRSDYVDDVESKRLVYGALKGMLSSLDDFSQFMEPDEFREIKLETKGEFGGIGVEISMKEGVLTVIAPIAGAPADTAGIKSGDKIVKIDGRITKEMTINDAVKMMRGEPGTLLTLTVWREKDQKVLDVSIKRDTIRIQSVKKASLLEDKIGYVKLAEFQEKSPRDMEDALKKLEADGMDSLILDLRNNPGGLLDTAVAVAEKFLPKDKDIVSIKGRLPTQNLVFKSSGKHPHPEYPLIILVNEGSASASEIVAGAIQDHKRGVIMGVKTFGKGSVQTVIPMRDGSALRLTTASYFTPAGRMIRDQGVLPDVVVEREGDKAKVGEVERDIFEKLEKKKESPEPEYDNQLARAVDLMKALKVYPVRKSALSNGAYKSRNT